MNISSRPNHPQANRAPQATVKSEPQSSSGPEDSVEISSADEAPLSNKIFGAVAVAGFSAIPGLGGLLTADSIRATERLGVKDEAVGRKLLSAGLNFAGTLGLVMGSAPIAVTGLGLSALTALAIVADDFK